MTTPARKTQYQVPHEVSRVLTFADVGLATGVLIGVVPAGSVLGTTNLLTTTAWNGTTSVALSVGTTLTGTQLISGSDIRTAAARVDTVVPIAAAGSAAGPLAADTSIYASIAFGGTAGTAGVTVVRLTFSPNLG